MRGKEPMSETITFRASDDEIAAYQRAWKQLQYRSQSEFHRAAGNILANNAKQNRHPINPTALAEINTHLMRIGTVLSELITLAANDNQPPSEQFGHDLRKALQDVAAIRRKVS